MAQEFIGPLIALTLSEEVSGWEIASTVGVLIAALFSAVAAGLSWKFARENYLNIIRPVIVMDEGFASCLYEEGGSSDADIRIRNIGMGIANITGIRLDGKELLNKQFSFGAGQEFIYSIKNTRNHDVINSILLLKKETIELRIEYLDLKNNTHISSGYYQRNQMGIYNFERTTLKYEYKEKLFS